ncbi:MAG: response regulator [Myxococcales bacterium]|nr:response regulator [Myxococcales bacterium]MCB9718146.1 response regulator [Myxococcales bacterium]
MNAGLLHAAQRVRAAVEALRRRAEAEGADSMVSDLGKMLLAADALHVLLERLPERSAEAQAPEAQRKLRHDLRTPVNQILGYCELLVEEAEDDEDTRWDDELRDIHEQTQEVLAAIDQIGVKPSGISAEVSALTRPPPGLVGTVLVVDDNHSNRELLERRLGRDGFSVLTAAHGLEALSAVRSHDVDVVLLDIMMPVMDGYETLDRLKADPELRHLPVIMLTSLDESESITRCIERGAEDHLPKPFDPVLLRARIGSSLERKQIRDRERRYLARIVAEKKRADDLLHGVIPIGVALSAERDFDRLLDRLLREARRSCGADGGVLFLRKDERLERVRLQCESISSATGDPRLLEVDLPSMDLAVPSDGRLRPSAKAARQGVTVQLDDLDGGEGLDLSAVKAFDARHHHVTRSLVALPLRSAEGEVIGVLELWNASRATDGAAVPFDSGMVDVLESLSRLAGAALESYRRETELRRRIRHLEIRIDEVNRRREVSQITETDYFRNLRDMAQKLRASAEPGGEG